MSSILCISIVVSLGQSAEITNPTPTYPRQFASPLSEDSLENSALRIALNNRMAEVNFQYAELDLVLHELSSKGRINLSVDWAALREFRIFADTPVTLNAKDIRLARAIDATLQIADEGRGILVSNIDDGILVITTRERLNTLLQTRIYDVDCLVNAKLDERGQYELQRAVTALWLRHFHVFAPPWEWMPSHIHNPDSGYRKGQLVGPEREVNQILDELLKRLRSSAEQDLVNVIRNIAPQSWQENGGTGSIQFFDTKLIVRQSAAVHSEIDRLLKQLEPDTHPGQSDAQ